MLKWNANEGERGLSRTKVPGPPGSVPATADDIVACLRANLTTCGEVMAAMGWVTDQALAVTGERAEQAERERDEWAELWATASRLCDEAQARADRALGITPGERDALRARLAKTEAVVEAAREDAQHCPHACSPPCPFDRAVARTRAALRALDDSPVGASTDSGGSGAATPEGGHAAPTGGPMPPPEPAGSSLEATRDLQAPATRAELEELRREVLETVADVCLRADDNAQAPWPWPLTRLGAELRRRVERLEGG